jgi:hypothetical protein
MTVYGPQPPRVADVAAATAATQAAIDRGASLADVERAAEAEQATFAAWRHAPELDHISPEREPEAEAG